MVHVVMCLNTAYGTHCHVLEPSLWYMLSCAGTHHMVHVVMCRKPAYDTRCHVQEASIIFMVTVVMCVQRRFKVVCASAQSEKKYFYLKKYWTRVYQ